jgi:hypothetical protein
MLNTLSPENQRFKEIIERSSLFYILQKYYIDKLKFQKHITSQ